MSRSADRVLVGVVVLVLVLGAGVAWIAAGRAPAHYEAGTPEAAAQQFLAAALDGDHEAVADMLVDGGCSPVDLARTYVPDSARVVLVRTTARDDRASVRVAVTEGSGALFDTGGWTHEEVVSLVLVDGTWRVDPASWPLYECVGW